MLFPTAMKQRLQDYLWTIQSSQEADTKILHTLYATERGGQSLIIFTPGTNILALAIH